MTIFGKNGIVRKQEIAFAKKLLVWKYENSGTPLPDDAALSAHAESVVKDAHAIAKKRGGNILEILKDAVNEIRKR